MQKNAEGGCGAHCGSGFAALQGRESGIFLATSKNWCPKGQEQQAVQCCSTVFLPQYMFLVLMLCVVMFCAV